MARVVALFAWAVSASVASVAQTVAPPAPVAAASTAAASVKAGVEKWKNADWAGAVAAWRPFAVQGDADALFNMGQAYKLGRGVPKDVALARDNYRRAATKGHLPAQANLGILLFQAGEKAESMRWLKAAADKGEMRAQYVYGIASFNGDGTPRNLGLAFGYLQRASAQGLSQATNALGNIEGGLSPADRAIGDAVNASLAAGQGVPVSLALRPSVLATRDDVLKAPPSSVLVTPSQNAVVTAPASSPRIVAPSSQVSMAQPLQPRTTAGTAPAATPAPGAVRIQTAPPPTPVRPQAMPVTPPPAVTVPATGAGEARPSPPPAALSIPVARAGAELRAVTPQTTPATVTPTEAVKIAAPGPAPALPGGGQAMTSVVEKAGGKRARAPSAQPKGWRVQLGAFSKPAQAADAWARFRKAHKDTAGKTAPIYDTEGGMTRLQLGPFKDKAAAKDACARMAFAGQSCFVVAGG